MDHQRKDGSVTSDKLDLFDIGFSLAGIALVLLAILILARRARSKTIVTEEPQNDDFSLTYSYVYETPTNVTTSDQRDHRNPGFDYN